VASRRESKVVYGAGLVQGIALVTFPAASAIFTEPSGYGLSSSAYGALFLPQAIAAIASSLLGAEWSRRAGTRRIYLIGLVADLLSMTLLLASDTVRSDSSLAYALLLLATTSLGIGFGFTVPALNTFIAAFHPDKVDASVLTLNALLGLGTALAPVFVAAFVGLGFWWGLPLLTALLLVIILAVSSRLPLRTPVPEAAAAPGARAGAAAGPHEAATTPGTAAPGRPRARIPARFWVFALFALPYGVCETMSGNWSSLDMTRELGASATLGSLALTTFWAMVTVGRVGFAAAQRRFPAPRAYHLLPFVLALAFVFIAVLPTGSPALGVLAFGLAGLGCSALLPLTISFGQEQLVVISASVAGGVIAFYQLGYGIAAFGAGPLQAAGISLPTLYGLTAIVAAAMGVLSFAVARRGAAAERASGRGRNP
jgi:fucose permease